MSYTSFSPNVHGVRPFLAFVLAVPMMIGCAERNPGDGKGFLGGEAGSVAPCPTNAVECPDSGAPPTYSNDVAPILEAHCTGCHGPGGENNDVPLTSYKLLMKKKGTSTVATTSISNVQDCKMPPPPLPRVSEEERRTLVCWFARGKAE
jgi:hypothetical protein